MTCQDQSSHPSPQLSWINSNHMELVKGAVYTINKATPLSTGSYMCKSQQGAEFVYSDPITVNITCKLLKCCFLIIISAHMEEIAKKNFFL